ncbi:MAG: hypothetical protein ACREOO_09985 [bacterium]
MPPAWRRLQFSFVLFWAAYFWLPTNSLAQSSWLLSSRLQSGLEYDGNIYESSALNVAATAGRLLFQTRAEKNMARGRIDVDYTGALQIYPDYRRENKLLQDLNGGLQWQATGRFRFFARGQATLKLYLNNVTDYGTTTGIAGVGAAITPRIATELSVETGQLDYALGSDFDFTFKGAWLTLRFHPGSTLAWEAAVLQRQINYPSRLALTGTGMLLSLPQNDDLTTFRLAANYGRKYFLRARLEAQRNRSTRDIFDYDRAQFHFLFGCNPAPRWLLRAAAVLQRKRYLVPSSPVSLPELDAEREQSNHVVVDVTRNLSGEASLVLRLAYHNNETPVRGLFYRKVLLFTGFEIRF